MPGRKYELVSGYRYGFNGKEKDNEISLGGQDYGMRIYNASLCRFLTTDPIASQYPMLTPYQFASNTPIQAIDFDGLEGVQIIDDVARTITIRVNFIYVIHQVEKGIKVTHNSPQNLIKSLENEISKLSPSDLIDEETGYAIKFLFSTQEFPTIQEAEDYINLVSNDINEYSQFFDLIPEKSKTYTKINDLGEEIEYIATVAGIAKWRRLFLTSTKDDHNVTHEFFHNLIHNHKNAPADLQNQIDLKNQEAGHVNAGGIFQYANPEYSRTELRLNKKNIKDVLRSLPKVKPDFMDNPDRINNKEKIKQQSNNGNA